MKAPFAIILMLTSFAALTQEIPPHFLDSVLKNFKMDSVKNGNISANLFPMQRSWTKINSTKFGIVYALPQDNMPCIVPDMREHKIMPNAGSKLLLIKPADPGIYANPGAIYSRVFPFKPRKSTHIKTR